MNLSRVLAALGSILAVSLASSATVVQSGQDAETELRTLIRRATDKAQQTDPLRRALLSFCQAHPGTALHRKAAECLATLPSPLDVLDPEKIDAELRQFLSVPGMVAFVRSHNRAVAALAFSPDGQCLASSGWDNTVRLWRLDGTAPREFATIAGSPSGIAFTADGKELVVGSAQSRVVIWDIDGMKAKARVNLAGHKYRPFAVQIAPTGKMLATGSLEPVLRLWKFEEGQPEIWAALANEQDAPALGVSTLSFRGDGKLLAAGSHLGKQTLRIWDVAGTYLEERILPAAQARTVQFAPTGSLLAFAAEDEAIRLWSVTDAEPKALAALKGHRPATTAPAIKALAFSPTGAILASAGQDRRVVLWDVAAGRKQREWHLLDEARALAFAPDGRHLAVGNVDGTLYILRIAAPP